MRKILEQCPTCGDSLTISQVRCSACGTEVNSQYRPCDFCGLTEEQAAFVRLFVTNRGKLNAMEDLLGVSYPTVSSKLDEIISKLQSSAGQRPASIPQAAGGPPPPLASKGASARPVPAPVPGPFAPHPPAPPPTPPPPVPPRSVPLPVPVVRSIPSAVPAAPFPPMTEGPRQVEFVPPPAASPGLAPESPANPGPPISHQTRLEVLELLSRGSLSPKQALEMLKQAPVSTDHSTTTSSQEMKQESHPDSNKETAE